MSATLIALLLAGCGTVLVPSPDEPWPVDPEAATDPARMVVEPAVAEPGAVVEVSFPTGHERGILFALDRPIAGAWERIAYMVSDANGGVPTWFHAGDGDVAVEAIGIAGEGPDRVPVPDGLPDGTYRICTGNALENLCAAIEVAAP